MKVATSSKKKAPAKAVTPTKKKVGASTSSKSAYDVILELLAESYSCGEESLPRDRLTKGTGLKPKTVANAITKLKQEELIVCDPKSLHLTEAGIQKVGTLANIATTNAERQERLKEKLKGRKAIELFELLSDGGIYDKDETAKALGYDGKKVKSFMNLIASVKGQGLLEYPDSDSLQLTDMCFPFGRGSE